MSYCKCDAPLYTETNNECRRCGLPVVVLHRDDEHSMRVDVLAANRQERLDNLTPPTGLSPVWDDAGTVDVRLLCGVAAVAALALVVWLVWPYLVGAGVIAAGWRVATRHTRRRRPRSSWSSLGRTAAMMYAAWNSRWLKGVSPVRVSVPRAATGPVDDRGRFACDIDDTIPY